jgi:hypothetical protein
MEDLRKGTCPLCAHNEIIEADVFVKTNDGNEASVVIATVPTRGFVQAFKEGMSGVRQHSRGQLVVYACRRCGCAQSFVADPSNVPIGNRHGTRIITGAKPPGPYR